MLVDLPNWVGDQMIALPALNRLLEGNRGGQTVLHTRPSMARLLAAVFDEARVVSSPRKTTPLTSARTIRESRERFDIGITLRNSARAKILVRLLSKWAVGSRGEGASILLSQACLVDRGLHQVHDADAILTDLGLDGADPLWRPSLAGDIHNEGRELMRAAGVDRDRAIGLAPTTARGEGKRWPVGRYGDLARRLADQGHAPVVVIGPGEDKTAAALCASAGRDFPIVGHETDVAGLAALVAALRLLVGNDSGPMQVAARFGTPVVAIFGPTDSSRTGPLGRGHRVVRPSPDLSDSMTGISVDDVHAEIIELLDRGDDFPRGSFIE